MSERERLDDLFANSDCPAWFIDNKQRRDTVDYLLANGVIVPPCKVGDTVYFRNAELQEVCPAKVIAITDNYYSPSCRFWITIEYDSKIIGKQTVKMMADVFKLLCHKTKEEAEAKLKERGRK